MANRRSAVRKKIRWMCGAIEGEIYPSDTYIPRAPHRPMHFALDPASDERRKEGETESNEGRLGHTITVLASTCISIHTNHAGIPGPAGEHLAVLV